MLDVDPSPLGHFGDALKHADYVETRAGRRFAKPGISYEISFDSSVVSVACAPRTAEAREWHYADQSVALRRGDQMGCFLLGSTVVMLFPSNTLRLQTDWVPGRIVRMGEAMAVSLES
jgi:phosphatidylserine decarboxylase